MEPPYFFRTRTREDWERPRPRPRPRPQSRRPIPPPPTRRYSFRESTLLERRRIEAAARAFAKKKPGRRVRKEGAARKGRPKKRARKGKESKQPAKQDQPSMPDESDSDGDGDGGRAQSGDEDSERIVVEMEDMPPPKEYDIPLTGEEHAEYRTTKFIETNMANMEAYEKAREEYEEAMEEYERKEQALLNEEYTGPDIGDVLLHPELYDEKDLPPPLPPIPEEPELILQIPPDDEPIDEKFTSADLVANARSIWNAFATLSIFPQTIDWDVPMMVNLEKFRLFIQNIYNGGIPPRGTTMDVDSTPFARFYFRVMTDPSLSALERAKYVFWYFMKQCTLRPHELNNSADVCPDGGFRIIRDINDRNRCFLLVNIKSMQYFYGYLIFFVLVFFARCSPASKLVYLSWVHFKQASMKLAGVTAAMERISQESISLLERVNITPGGPSDNPQSVAIPLDEFSRVIFSIASNFKENVFDTSDEDGKEWLSRPSGTVVTMDSNEPYYLIQLETYEGLEVLFGAFWKTKFTPIIDEIIPKGIAVIKNTTDYLCLYYTIIMGLIKSVRRNAFNRSRYVSVLTLQNVVDRDTGLPKRVYELMKNLREKREGISIDLMEKSEGVWTLSVSEAIEIFRTIENELLKDEKYALDVFMIKMTGKGRIFPGYCSSRKTEERISVLCMAFPSGESHFALITNMEKLFRCNDGKIFETCHSCHRSFFTREGLLEHKKKGKCEDEDLEKSYHWSTIDEEEKLDASPVGRCERCHLLFSDQFAYDFHMKHCFMQGRTGSRYVSLVEREKSSLTAEFYECDELPKKRIYFADFECYITKEGKHEFMSYGIFCNEDLSITIGYSLKSFFDYLVKEAKRAAQKKEGIFVYFHNAMGYDANFLIRKVLEDSEYKKWSIKVIMKSASHLESLKFKFRSGKELCSITIGDTCKFLTMSLDRIVASIRKDDVEENKKNFKNFFRLFGSIYEVSDSAIDKVLRKNLFPYRYFTSPERLDDIWSEQFGTVFEPREENLQYFGEDVTLEKLQKNYRQVCEIHTLFRTYSAKSYHDLYLRCDVLQIADVFLKCRETLFESHHIDVCDYIGMPSASWHAFLRHDPLLNIPLYTNTIFAEFFQSMTRGGVTSAPLRYAEADETHSILYFDVNGLYPYVMQAYKYPCGRFRWFTPPPSFTRTINDYLMDYFEYLDLNGQGACFVVDLHVPESLHDYFDDFPPAPEHKTMKEQFFDDEGNLYPFLEKWSKANGDQRMGVFKGLVGTLEDKKEYGVHWKLLRWYISHGVEVTKLYYGVIFEEGDYLASYVRKNIAIRNQRTDELGKIVYKLMGNSIYGKTFENPFNRGKFYIVRNRDKLTGIMEQKDIAQITPITDQASIIKLDGEKVVLDKPTYIGACVTEYAKLHMYILFYDKLKAMFEDVRLVYTDTDSFIIRIKHEANATFDDIMRIINEKDPDLVGKIGGQIKSETGSDLIKRVVALRSKLYAYETMSGHIGKRAKGTTAAAQEKELDFDTYIEALTTLKAIPTRNVQFKRKAFSVSTVELMKQSISVNDGKRRIEEDGIHTHAWGYLGSSSKQS